MAVPQPDESHRFSGTARVLISVGADGAQVNVAVRTPSPYGEFEAWLWAALQDANFSARCAGETIEVNFIYELRGEPMREPHSKMEAGEELP